MPFKWIERCHRTFWQFDWMNNSKRLRKQVLFNVFNAIFFPYLYICLLFTFNWICSLFTIDKSNFCMQIEVMAKSICSLLQTKYTYLTYANRYSITSHNTPLSIPFYHIGMSNRLQMNANVQVCNVIKYNCNVAANTLLHRTKIW